MNKETAIIAAYKDAAFYELELEKAQRVRDMVQENYSALMREDARAAITELCERRQGAFADNQVARAIVFFLSDTPANDADYRMSMHLDSTLNDLFRVLERGDETADEHHYLVPMDVVTEEDEDGIFEGVTLSRGRWSVRYRLASAQGGGQVTRGDRRAPWNQYEVTITEAPERA